MAKKILIIDDDVNLATTLKNFLEEAGYELSTASDSYSGIEAAIRDRPSLIILDMQMPAGGGGVVFERIKQNAFINTTPVIFSTSLPADAVRKILPQDTQIHGYFQKPADLDALLQRITDIIGAP